jgi:signal transduction histidine kinase/AraC-like DNA-binding protein/streptogramin lyase
MEDRSGNLWFGTLSGGVNKYDGINFVHLTDKEGLSYNDVRSIMEDRSGNLWFGTMGGGVNRYAGRSFTQFTEKEGLSNNFVWSIIEDKTGNLWFGTQNGGVNLYDGKYFIHITDKDGLNPGTVFSILEDKNGNIWFGTGGGGVSKFDGRSFTHFTEKEGLCNNWVWDIIEDKRGNLWFGTNGGVSKFDGQYFTHFTVKQGLSNNIVKAILEDKSGNIWFGTIGGGISKFNGRGFTQFTEKEGLNHNSIHSMLEDKKGNLWFGTAGGGVSKFDGLNFTHYTDKEGLSHNFVESIMEDKMGNMWFGARFGLNKLERGQLHSFPNQKSSGNTYKTSSRPDEFGILFKTYTHEDGFSGIGVNAGKSIYEAINGTIWIGAGDRLTAFHPENAPQDTIAPNIQLTGLSLFNENIPWKKLGAISKRKGNIFLEKASGKDKDDKIKDTILILGNGVRVDNFQFDGLSSWYGVPENLNLSYDNNHLTFQFVGITTHSPKKVKYQYQLEGVDPHWSGITNRGEASYSNLPHGQYTFKVRAMNGQGIWSGELKYPFKIRPPWWHTWWAQTLYAIMGVGLLYGLRKYTVNRERIKHTLKIQKLETEKMHEVDQLKSRFFANISHEFRTPLTLILGPLECFVSQSSAESPERPVYQMMQRNARRLLHLINQLLDLSKIETGRMELDTKPADLVSFLKSVVLVFSSHAERRHINYNFQYPPGRPVVYFDRDKLEKIITNLLSNAFKFTPPGGKITVTASFMPFENKPLPAAKNKEETEANISLLEIKVKDSGTGIPVDQTKKIFDRFYQIDPSHTREQEGSGIGLSLVRELVELHEGEIFVESQVGQGSCFTIRLPVVMADFEEMTISEPASDKKLDSLDQEEEMVYSAETIMEDADPNSPLMLIIDDNADVRLFIREYLQPLYQVLEAADGEEGYRLAVEAIPDLILSDVMMPKMDGVELCRKLKTNEKTAHIPLILLTAKASGGDKMEGLETGADDYLIKPFEAAELLMRIKNLIDGRKKLRDHFSREIILQPRGIAITSVDERFLNQAMKIIEDHMADPALGLDVFCRELGMSRTQLFRKTKALTNYAPGDFIRLMRLKRAAELLSLGAGSIAEVGYRVGFQDPSYFTKCFQKQFGKTPSEFIIKGQVKTK